MTLKSSQHLKVSVRPAWNLSYFTVIHVTNPLVFILRSLLFSASVYLFPLLSCLLLQFDIYFFPVYPTNFSFLCLSKVTNNFHPSHRSRDSSVGNAARLWAGLSQFDSPQGLGIFLFATASRQSLGPTQPRPKWVSEVPSAGVMQPGRESDHSPPSSCRS
jgi:hypothetical protein